MKQLILLPDAIGDLADIRNYTTRQWGLAQAETYLGKMGAAFRKITGGEAVSREVEHRDLRKLRFQSHMIYFLETDDSVQIVRVLHGSMDAERHLD